MVVEAGERERERGENNKTGEGEGGAKGVFHFL